MNKLLILTSYAKFELKSLIPQSQWNYWSQEFLAVSTKRKSEMTSYLNNGSDVTKYFAKFEKHTKFYDCRKSNARVRPGRELFAPPPPKYKLCSQNTPYKVGLNVLEYNTHTLTHLRT